MGRRKRGFADSNGELYCIEMPVNENVLFTCLFFCPPARHGGKVASVYHQDCTHLVLRHKKQDLYSVAVQLDQTVVSADFILRCLSEKKLLEETEQVE